MTGVQTCALPISTEMDDAKRRAAIKSKAAKNKETDVGAMGTGSSRPLAKRPMPKVDRAPKKRKVSTEPVIGLMAEGKKTVTPAKPGAGKGLMVPPPGSQKNRPSYSVKIQNMPWGRSLPSLGARTTRTWGTTRRRPWGRRASSALPK